MKIFFVILHYQNLTITQKCIDEIICLELFNICTVVIVDNASPNQSGKALKRLYHYNTQIIIIESDENIGFAKGNNLGYQYAKSKNADLIIVMNNDVLIYQRNFLNILLESNYTKRYYIIGPDIISGNDHQNPLRMQRVSNRKIVIDKYYNLALSCVYSNFVFGSIFLWLKNKLKKFGKIIALKGKLENVVLHGSCLIYTKEWIENEDIAFIPITFMYGEEDVLYYHVTNRNYKTLFLPELVVYHERGASLSNSGKDKLASKKFSSMQRYKTLCVLEKYFGGE